MKMTDTPVNVVEALSAVMDALPSIGRDSRAAREQGGYAYRGIEAITKEAQPLFARFGVVFAPSVLRYDIKDITVGGRPWTDTILSVQYRVYGPKGPLDFIDVGPIIGIGRDNSDKGANKALTQTLKYAMLQVFCISDAKDDGDKSSHEADYGGSEGGGRVCPACHQPLGTEPLIRNPDGPGFIHRQCPEVPLSGTSEPANMQGWENEAERTTWHINFIRDYKELHEPEREAIKIVAHRLGLKEFPRSFAADRRQAAEMDEAYNEIVKGG
jgi:hypothetical protein